MSCLLSAGLSKECRHEFGGIKELKLGNFDELEELSYDEDGVVTGITMVSGATLYDFEFVKDTGQALEELQDNGASSFINQTINAQFNAITQEKKKALDDLSLTTVFAIVKKADDNYWFFAEPAKSAGLEADSLSIDTGTSQSDVSAASVTLVGGSLNYAPMVDKDALDNITEASE